MAEFPREVTELVDQMNVSEADICLIEEEVGYGIGGWDSSNVPPGELIRAVLKVMLPQVCRRLLGVKCFCGCHVSSTMEKLKP